VTKASRGILKFTFVGTTLCAGFLFFFGDGWLMAFYLAIEGMVLGSIAGGFVGCMWAVALGFRTKDSSEK
jgi:hypothetical protein